MAACPMTNNWRELPQMLEFCLDKNIALYFNVVFTPFELTLRELGIKELEEVISFLDSYSLPAITGNPQSPRNLSISAYADFVLLLKGWLADKKEPLSANISEISSLPDVDWSLEEISGTIDQLIDLQHMGFTERQRELQTHLAALFVKTPKGRIADSQYCFIRSADKYLKKESDTSSYDKLKQLSSLIEEHPYRDSILSMSSQAQPLAFATLIEEKKLEELQQIFAAQFSSRL